MVRILSFLKIKLPLHILHLPYLPHLWVLLLFSGRFRINEPHHLI